MSTILANAFGWPFRISRTVVSYSDILHTAGLQQIVTNLRTVLDIMKVYTMTAPNLLAIRSDAAHIQMVQWLIPKLDTETPNTSGNEARFPNGNDDVVHVFYLEHVTSPEGINGLLTEIRKTTHIGKAYDQTVPAALVLRGTADQIAMAAGMIKQADQPVAAKP